MNKKIVKLQLKINGRLKACLADIDDVIKALGNINQFIRKYFSEYDTMKFNNGYDKNIDYDKINFHQYSPLENKTDNPKKKKSIKDFFIKLFSKSKKKSDRNKKWTEYGIYPVPIPTIIFNPRIPKDFSKAHIIDIETLEKIFINNVFSVFYENTLNYAKYIDGRNIHLHCVDSSKNNRYGCFYDISPNIFLRIVYTYWVGAKERSKFKNRYARHILNSVYGAHPEPTTQDRREKFIEYLDLHKDIEFGKFNISYTYETQFKSWKEEKEIPLTIDTNCRLVDEIENFIKENQLPHEGKIDVTFISDFMDIFKAKNGGK